MFRYRYRALPPFDGHTSGRPFPSENTHSHCGYASLDKAVHDVKLPTRLFLRSSFTKVISGLERSN